MKDTTTNAEETIADLIALTRPHRPGLERATRGATAPGQEYRVLSNVLRFAPHSHPNHPGSLLGAGPVFRLVAAWQGPGEATLGDERRGPGQVLGLRGGLRWPAERVKT